MPLNTQILREKEEVKLGWTERHLWGMLTAACAESRPTEVVNDDGVTWFEASQRGQVVSFATLPIYYLGWDDVPLYGDGRQVLTQDHTFRDPDGEPWLELKTGDVLRMWRSSK
jgi:hypothetical protein